MLYQYLQQCRVRQLGICANAIRRVQTKLVRRVGTVVPFSTFTNATPQPQNRLIRRQFTLELCGEVANLLNKANVENVLWGQYFLAAYRVPTIIAELSFAVASNQLQKAVALLESESFLLCRDMNCLLNKPRDCKKLTYDNPHAHFHLDGIPRPPFHEYYGAVQLYTVEDRFWDMDIIGKGVDFTDGPSKNLIFANDASLAVGTSTQGFGRFPESISGVRIPTLHRYAEALILLALRSELKSLATSGWVAELAYIVELVDLHRLSHPAFRQFCTRMLAGSPGFKIMIWQAYQALKPRLCKDMHWKEIQTIRAF